MMKYLFCGLFLLLTSTGNSQIFTTVQWQASAPLGDTIFYQPGESLTWKDFQGEPEKRSIAIAITASGFGFSMSMKSRNGKTTLMITVNCFFNKKNSWVKPGMRSDYALLHEQHHFDITYIAACQFVKKLKAANFTLSNYSALIDKLNDESYVELERMQNDYDGQTKNGQLKDVQAEWNKKIDQQLAALLTN